MAYGSFAFPGGSSDYLTLSGGPVLGSSTSTPFTLECWVYFTGASASATYPLMASWDGSDANSWAWQFDNSDNNSTFYAGTSSVGGSIGPIPDKNIWQHFAIVRSGTTFYFFKNGALIATNTFSCTPTDQQWYIGRNRSAADTFEGLIADIRVSTVARYTTNYTVPTAPLTADADTIMSLSVDYADTDANNLTDKSPTSSGTYTIGGAVTISAFNPFSKDFASLNEINVVKQQQQTAANKLLLIPEDPLIDQSVVFPENAFNSYRT